MDRIVNLLRARQSRVIERRAPPVSGIRSLYIKVNVPNKHRKRGPASIGCVRRRSLTTLQTYGFRCTTHAFFLPYTGNLRYFSGRQHQHGRRTALTRRWDLSYLSGEREAAGVHGEILSSARPSGRAYSWLHTRVGLIHKSTPLNTCAMPVRRLSFGKLFQQLLPEPLDLSVSRVRPHGRSSGSPPARL